MRNVILLPSYVETFRKIQDPDDKLEFIESVINYLYEGKEPNLYGTLDLLWTALKPNMDSTIRNYENGKKGGRPPKTPLVSNKTPLFNNENPPLEENKPKKKKEKEKEKDMDKNKEKDIEKEMSNIFTIQKNVNEDNTDFNTLLEHAHLLDDYVK